MSGTLTVGNKSASAVNGNNTDGTDSTGQSGGDTVTFSRLGLEMSASLQAGSGGSMVSEEALAQAESDATYGVTVDDVEQELRLKKSQRKSVQSEVDQLKGQVTDDPAKQAELSKSENKLRNLEQEVADLES